MTKPTCKTIFTHPVHFVASGFGLGLLPKMPGTFGTMLAFPVYFLLQDSSLCVYLGVVAGVFLLGTYVAHHSSRLLGADDPSVIVIDEVAGMLLALTALPPGWLWLAAGFILFRLFDVIKPWPVCWIDQHVKGGIGIMLDDMLAGLFTLILIQMAWFWLLNI